MRSSVSTPSKWWFQSSCWLFQRGQHVLKNNYFFFVAIRVLDCCKNSGDVAAARCTHRQIRVQRRRSFEKHSTRYLYKSSRFASLAMQATCVNFSKKELIRNCEDSEILEEIDPRLHISITHVQVTVIFAIMLRRG